MPITVTVPTVTGAVLAPNPVTINHSVAATVTITEEQKTLYEQYQYCGVARCGGGI